MTEIVIGLIALILVISGTVYWKKDYLRKVWIKHKKKIIAVLSTTALLGVGSSVFIETHEVPRYSIGNWIIDKQNNTVYVNDSFIYASATPHTTHGGDVVFELESKVYAGDVDFAWGFNQSIMKPTKIWLWQNYSHPYYYWGTTEDYGCITLHNVTGYTNLGIENYNNYSVTLGNSNNTYLFNVTYENGNNTGIYAFSSFTQNDNDYTICGNYDKPIRIWNNQTYFDWKPWNVDYTHISWNYENMTDWYIAPHVTIQSGIRYKCKIKLQRTKWDLEQHNGKYWFAFKPSSETLLQAVVNGHFYALDPWWNSSWSYYKVCNIANANNSYQMRINLSYDSTLDGGENVTLDSHCNANFSDIRFVDIDNTTVLPYWIEEKVDSDYALVWVNTSSDVATDGKILLYYGNPNAISQSNGDTTWDYFLEWTSDHTSEFTDQYWVPDGDPYNARRWTHNKTIPISSSPLKLITKFRVYDYNPHSYAGGVGFGLADNVTDDSPDTSISFRFHADSDISGIDSTHFGVRIRSDVSGNSSYTDFTGVPYDSGNPWRYFVFTLNNTALTGSIYSLNWSTKLYNDTLTQYLPSSMDNLYYKTYAQDTAGWHEWSYDSSNNEIDMGGGRWVNDGYVRISYKWAAIGKYTSPEPTWSSFGESQTSSNVITNSSTGIGATNATLNGYLVDDGGETCSVWFEYGTTTTYSNETTFYLVDDLGDGNSDTSLFLCGDNSFNTPISTSQQFTPKETINATGIFLYVYYTANDIHSFDIDIYIDESTCDTDWTDGVKVKDNWNPPNVGNYYEDWIYVPFDTYYNLNASSTYEITFYTSASDNDDTQDRLEIYVDSSPGTTLVKRNGFIDSSEYCAIKFVSTTNSNETFSYNVSFLNPGTLYHYRAVANNSIGTSYGNDMCFLTRPNNVTDLTSNSGANWINLSWTIPTGANKTVIVRKQNGIPSNPSDGTLVYNGTGNFYNDTPIYGMYGYSAWGYAEWSYNSNTYSQFSSDYDYVTDQAIPTSTTTIRNDGVDYFVWLGENKSAYNVSQCISGFDEPTEYIAIWNNGAWSDTNANWNLYYGDGTGTNWTIHTFDVVKVYLTDTGTQTITMYNNTNMDYSASYSHTWENTTINKGYNFTGYNKVSDTTLSAINASVTLQEGEALALWNETNYEWDWYLPYFYEPDVTVHRWDVILSKVETTKIWTT